MKWYGRSLRGNVDRNAICCQKGTISKRVVPYVGTWIEIQYDPLIERMLGTVVPYVGTWIEICCTIRAQRKSKVVPYVGTWIEICSDSVMVFTALSRSFPTWERG